MIDVEKKTTTIPLFPLNAVMFPNMIMSMSIFEDKYKTLVNRCLESQSTFGIILIKSGSEVGGSSITYEVGTEIEIVEHEKYDDGKYRLLVKGTKRFKVMRLDYREDYLSAKVNYVEDDENQIVDSGVILEATSLFRDYMRYLVALNPGLEFKINNDDLLKTSYLIGQYLQIPPKIKQQLLEFNLVEDRLLKEIEILRSFVPTKSNSGYLA